MVRSLEKIMNKPLVHQKLEGFNYSTPAPDRPASSPGPRWRSPAPTFGQGKPANRQAPRSAPNRNLRQKYASGRTK
jgi:hypothetical protein